MRSVVLSAAAAALLLGGPATAQPPAAAPPAGGFTRWDKNKNNFLDPDELARAFRGPAAKPVEDKPGAKETHPDHQFLARWDADKDGKISLAEFERYEQKTIADLRAAATRPRNYTPGRRPGYRAAYSHRGYAGRGRGYGSNPYSNQLRYQQRAYQQLRQAYSGQRRYASYSPYGRGGYRGVLTHRGRRR